jgi:hypothetical protein
VFLALHRCGADSSSFIFHPFPALLLFFAEYVFRINFLALYIVYKVSSSVIKAQELDRAM